jgi:hypothetical protein
MTATVMTFDTHAFYNRLKSVGFSEQQAEAIAEIQKETATAAIEQTKHDFRLDDVTTKRDLKELELQLSIQIEKSRNDLIKWFVGTAFAIASIGFMLARFMTHGVL